MQIFTAEPAEISFTITIIRKETGKVETFNILGYVVKNIDNKNSENK